MWQRFTEDARRVVLLAQEEATRTQASAVDTEHFLVGLLALNEGQIGPLLERAGGKTFRVQTEAISAVANYPQGPKGAEPTLTSSAKRVLELAADEARRTQDSFIRPEYFLLALLRRPECKASQILVAQGVDITKVRTAVLELAQSQHWASFSQGDSQGNSNDEALLLSLLERRADLLVEILGLDVLALKKARLELLVRLDLYEQAALLRDEIDSEQS